jgi:hypothetical protein
MDYDLMVANCICDSGILQSEEKNDTNKEDKKDKSESVNFKSVTKSFISNLLSFNFDVMRCSNLAFNIKILLHNIGFYCLSGMFLLQIIFFFVYLAKGVKSIKIFMMIFNEKKKINITNNKDTKKNNKVNPPPKNNSKSKQTKKNKKTERLKKKIKNKFNKNKLKKKDYILNESNSKKNIVQKNNFDLENILNQGINPNLLNMQSISNAKNDSNGKLIISHNFAPTINIQTPKFNTLYFSI